MSMSSIATFISIFIICLREITTTQFSTLANELMTAFIYATIASYILSAVVICVSYIFKRMFLS